MIRWIARAGLTYEPPGEARQRFEAGEQIPQAIIDATTKDGECWLIVQGYVFDGDNPTDPPATYPRVTTLAPGLPPPQAVITVTTPLGSKTVRPKPIKEATGG